MTALLVILCVVLLVGLDVGRLYLKQRREAAAAEPAHARPFGSLSFPRGLFLDRSHTWVRMTESGELRLGVDELVSQAVDGADRMELPASGTPVKRGETMATLWRRGRKLSIVSPVDGTVVTSNHGLDQYPRDLVEDPYGTGWLATVWPVEHREALKPLAIGEGARKWMERETERFRDFLAKQAASEHLGVALADGATPVVGAALHLGDEGWAAFQDDFLQVKE